MTPEEPLSRNPYVLTSHAVRVCPSSGGGGGVWRAAAALAVKLERITHLHSLLLSVSHRGSRQNPYIIFSCDFI